MAEPIVDDAPSDSSQSHRSFDPDDFDRLAAVEDKHFWFRARNHIIAALIRQVVPDLTPGYHVLEVGCGTGNVLHVLEEACSRGTVIGMDLFAEGLRHARCRTSVALVQGDVHRPPFNTPFDVIGLFDVLEHLPDDIGILRSLRSLLAENGVLLLTVPAHPHLWSYFDEASCHCRRYHASELESKLQSAGFAVEYQTPFMMGIYPLMWLQRRVAALFHRRLGSGAESERTRRLVEDEMRIRPVVNELLTFLLSLEAGLLVRRRRLPIGTSLLAIARRTS